MTSTTCGHLLVERTIDGVTVARFTDAALLDEKIIGEVEEELWEIASGLGAVSLHLGFR